VIINGRSRRCVWWWSKHLQNTEENESVRVVKVEGLASEGIYDLLREIEAQGLGTKAQNPMWIAVLNPGPHESLTEEQRDRAREILEQERGLTGQPYFLVEHEKNGWKHWHVVYSRIDSERMRALPDGLDAKICHGAARKIEIELGLEKVIGPYDREPGTPRPPRAPAPWEMYRGMQTKIDPRDIAAEVTELYHQSQTGKEFHAALEDHGYQLATGRRGLLILDSAGKEHSLVKRIDGVKTAELNAFMREVDRAALPTVEQAKEHYQQRKIEGLEADRATVRHEIEWEEALSKAAIAKEKEQQSVQPNGRDHKEVRAGRKQAKPDGRKENAKEPQPEYPAPELGKTQGEIRLARTLSHGPQGFAHALEDRGFILARVTPDDIKKEMEQLRKEWEQRRREPQTWMEYENGFAALPPDHQASARRSFDEWKTQREKENKQASTLEDYVLFVQGKWSEGPKSQMERATGELAVVTPFGSVYTLTPRNTGLERDELPEYLKGINRAPLLSVTDAQAVMQDIRDHRGTEREIEQARRREEWKKERDRQREEEWKKELARIDQLPLNETVASIRLAYSLSQSPDGFIRNLDETGFKLARATKDEADRGHRNAAFAAEIGRYAPEYREGEYIAINERGYATSLNRRTTGDSREEIAAFMRTADHGKIQGIDATRQDIAAYKRPAPAREMFAAPPTVTGGIPMPAHTDPLNPWQQFGRAAREETRRDRAPDDMHGPGADIWTAYKRSDSARAFVAALHERNIAIAVVTREDVTNSEIDRHYAADLNTPRLAIPPNLREGDYVAVADNAQILNLNYRTTGEAADRVQKFMATLDRKEFQSVSAVLKTVEERAALRDIERQAFRDLSAGKLKGPKDGRPTRRQGRIIGGPVKDGIRASKDGIDKSARVTANVLGGVGKGVDAIANAFASLFPELTPEQKREAEITQHRREAEADASLDNSRTTAETTQLRRQEENDREAERERERDRGGRER
jgi:hypothetical protein